MYLVEYLSLQKMRGSIVPPWSLILLTELCTFQRLTLANSILGGNSNRQLKKMLPIHLQLFRMIINRLQICKRIIYHPNYLE